jgi:hypothetical protein
VARGLGGLTKPFQLFLVPFAIVGLAWRPRGLRPTVVGWIALLVPAGMLVTAWSAYNWRTQGVFGPSTMTGYRLAQLVGGAMEQAPDRYALLRDIYVRHRVAREDSLGTQVNTIWEAIPEMQRATGLSYGRLSLEVQSMSLAVLRAAPDVYARSVALAWVGFWKRPMYVRPPSVHSPSLVRPIANLALAQRLLLIALDTVGVLLAVALAWRDRDAATATARNGVLLFLAVVVTASIAQALSELSDNGRFAVPFLPLLDTAALVAIGTWWRRRRARVSELDRGRALAAVQ